MRAAHAGRAPGHRGACLWCRALTVRAALRPRACTPRSTHAVVSATGDTDAGLAVELHGSNNAGRGSSKDTGNSSRGGQVSSRRQQSLNNSSRTGSATHATTSSRGGGNNNSRRGGGGSGQAQAAAKGTAVAAKQSGSGARERSPSLKTQVGGTADGTATVAGTEAAVTAAVQAPQARQPPPKSKKQLQVEHNQAVVKAQAEQRLHQERAVQAALDRDSPVRPGCEPEELCRVAKLAAEAGAKVVTAALGKPPAIKLKGQLDLVTKTDEASEQAILEVLRSHYPTHAVLGEEGGVSGDPKQGYLWCVDPLDGTTNFAHQFPSFAVSVGVMRGPYPVAGCVIEFAGGAGSWVTRTYDAYQGGGARLNGQPIHTNKVSKLDEAILVTGYGYDHGLAWQTNMALWKDLQGRRPQDRPRGLHRLGAAAVDLCHVACGMADAYWELQLKPWDVCAGVAILTEAGGRVLTMDKQDYSPFHRTMVATNGPLTAVLLHLFKPYMAPLLMGGAPVDLCPAFIPDGYPAGFVTAVVERHEKAAEKHAQKKMMRLAKKEKEAREAEKAAEQAEGGALEQRVTDGGADAKQALAGKRKAQKDGALDGRVAKALSMRQRPGAGDGDGGGSRGREATETGRS